MMLSPKGDNGERNVTYFEVLPSMSIYCLELSDCFSIPIADTEERYGRSLQVVSSRYVIL
jgi:hypothetical protein